MEESESPLKYGSDKSRFYFYSASFSLMTILKMISSITSLTMMVLGPGYLVHALSHFLKIPFIVSMDYFHLVESLEYFNLVESLEYFHLVESLVYFDLFESMEYFDLFESMENFDLVGPMEYFDLVESFEYFPAQKHF